MSESGGEVVTGTLNETENGNGNDCGDGSQMKSLLLLRRLSSFCTAEGLCRSTSGRQGYVTTLRAGSW
jgi:hypothetical protein